MKNIQKIIVIMLLVLLSSCSSQEEKNGINMNIGEDGVEMNIGGEKFEAGEDGVKMNIGGINFEAGEDGVKMDIGGEIFEAGEDGVKMDIGGEIFEAGEDGVKMNIGGDSFNISDNGVKDKDFFNDYNEYKNFEETEEISDKNCEEEYNDLLNKYGKNYSDCYFNTPDVSSCESNKINKGKINLVVIFDDSGSMGSYIGDETMLDIAKEKVSDYISDLDSNTNLSFVLYGHKGSGTTAGKTESCEGVETIYNFGDSNVSSLLNKISTLKPNGYTPITKSLQVAQGLINDKTSENDKNIVLLVSDGKETCGSNPVLEAIKISKIKNTYVDVIGFNVEGDTQKQLMDIAKMGKGSYYDVKSKLDFEDTFQKTKNFLETMSCGASKAAISLNYGAEAINKYYSCIYKLREEQIFMMVDAPEQCKDYFEENLETRYDKYEKKFEPIMTEAENILDSFSEIIENIEDELDE